ncbi:MAG: hypothetical protein JO057_00835 [Chloroflexi bacterium]|nr:hypothetical protein [Chloroflexota bacterium]
MPSGVNRKEARIFSWLRRRGIQHPGLALREASLKNGYHHREMSLPPLVNANQAAEPSLEIEMDLLDDVDLPDELDKDRLAAHDLV